jgi:lipopolysaccharide/colanic/teichoic acid biosynthesis glycosyltransferase
MYRESTGPSVTVSNDARVTRVGRILRTTKLDELLGVWNVLGKDMALVGPRPEVPMYVDYGSPAWRRVVSVRPGITDPVSLQLINEEKLLFEVGVDWESFYRNELLPHKLQGQIEYLNQRTWRTDLRVLYLTVAQIVLRWITKNDAARALA